MTHIYPIFGDDHYNRPISELEFKPKLKLAKISEKYGFEDWLQSLKIKVKDIWIFYLFDDSLEYYYCSPFNPYHSLGYVGCWYDVNSLVVPHTVTSNGVFLTNGEKVESEYFEDGEFRFHNWFEDQIEVSGADDDGNAERSLLIHDFATHEGEFSLREMGLDQQDLECLTAAEVLSKAYEAVLEYRNSGSNEDLFNLFENEAIAVKY